MATLTSSRGLAKFGVKEGNTKLGPGVHTTSVAQVSCPDGHNSSYRCPLYGNGCYAEDGRFAMPGGTTSKVNAAAGLKFGAGSDSAKFGPKEAAEDEVEVIVQALGKGKLEKGRLLRLHIVGDAVSDDIASMLRGAVGSYPDYAPGTKGAWVYTHAWRSVSRSSWGGNISVIASCDTPDSAKQAMGRGYAAAVVVPCFKDNKAYDSGHGFKIQPCPEEAFKGKGIVCKKCRLCLQDERLRDQNKVIAFEAHNANRRKERQLKDKLARIFGACGGAK